MLGGLWLCLWRTSWRRFGLIGIALGVLLMPLDRPPDLLIDARGEIVAVRLDDGRLALSPWQRDRWITDSWLQSAGQDRPADWPAAGGGAAGDFACDPLGCVLTRAGQVVALARRPEAIEEDCRAADLVVSYPRIEFVPERHAADRPAARCATPAGSRSGSSGPASTCGPCATRAASVPGAAERRQAGKSSVDACSAHARPKDNKRLRVRHAGVGADTFKHGL